tara:strand:+ start:693 stop:914 length:222 start_codon:yes stop_codon:yes gene_type:complete
MLLEYLSEIFFRVFDRQKSETMAVDVGLIPVCDEKHGTTGPTLFAKMVGSLIGNMKTGHNLRVVRRNQSGKNE